MIKRIVKMEFQPEKVNDFKKIFKDNWSFISGFEGCNHVELLQDCLHANIFFTYSLWESEEALDRYRKSELFNSIWSKTKVLFCNKPEAWTVKQI